jgi:hypothetical protein
MLKLQPPLLKDDPATDLVNSETADGTLQDDLQDSLNNQATLLNPAVTLGDPPDEPVDPDENVASDVTKKMSRSLFDWKITDAEANQSFEALIALPDDKLQATLAKLGKTGKLKTLLEEIPAKTWRDRNDDVIRLFTLSPADVLEKHIRSLLKVGLFDWVVSETDVTVVLAALAVLPQSARDAFVADKNGYFYDRLMEAKESERIQEKAANEAAANELAANTDEAKVNTDPSTTVKDNHEVTDLTTGTTNGLVTKDGDKDGAKNKETPKEKGPGLFKKIGALGNIVGDVFGDAAVDLDDVSTLMGGDIAGVKLDETAGNRVDLGADWQRGLLFLDVPSIGVKSVAMEGVAAGASSLSGLRGEVKFKTTADKGSWISLDIGQIALGEVHLTVGADAYAIKGLTIDVAHLKATDSPITQSKPLGKGDAIKLILNQIGDAIGLSLPAIKGVLGGDYEKPDTLMEHFGKEFNTDANVSFTVQNIHLDEVAKNGQSMAQSVDIAGFSVDVLDVSILPQLEAEAAELKEKSGTTELTAPEANRLTQLTTLIAEFPKKEARLTELEGKAKSATLGRNEQNELIELRNELRIGAVHLIIDSVDTGGVDIGGNGVESAHLKGVDVTATGGPMESMRHQQSDREKLDDLIGAKHSTGELIENKETPGIKINGSVDDLDLNGLKYTDPDMGVTTLSTDAKNLKFGYDMASGDATASADAFNVDQLHFGEGAGEEYANYETMLGHAGGTNLDFAMNTNTLAMTGSADNLAGTDLKMPGYKTSVGNFGAGTASFGMNELGDITANGQCVTADDVKYEEQGYETGIKKATVDDFQFDMSERKEGDKSVSKMSASGTGAHIEGLDYLPSTVRADEVNAGTFGFSMIDETDGVTTRSSISLDGTGVDAKGIEYAGTGNETKLGGVSANTLNFDMQSGTNGDGTSYSDMAANGEGLKMNGVEYAPNDIAVGSASADTYAFEMNDKTDATGTTTSKVQVGGTGVGATDFTMGQEGDTDYVGVKKLDAKAGNFTMNPDGTMNANAADVKAGGVVYGTGGDQITAGNVTAGTVGYDAQANGDMTLNTTDVTGGNIQYGDKKTGIHVGGVASNNVDVAMTGGETTVTSGWIGATNVKDKGHGIGVDKANVNGFALKNGQDGLSIDADKFDAKGVSYTDPNAVNQKTPTATVSSLKGTDLDIDKGDDGLDLDIGHVETGDVRYGSTKHGGTGVHTKGAVVDGVDLNIGDNGVSGSVANVSAGETWIRTDKRMSYLKDANVNDINATNFDYSSEGGLTGSIGATSITANDIRTTADDKNPTQVTNVNQLTVNDALVTGNGDQVGIGASSVNATGIKHQDDGLYSSVGSVNATTINSSISGLTGEKINFDGVTAEGVTAKDLHGDVELWNLLGKKADPTATDEDGKPGGKFKADALAHASGKLTATIPIDIDLGWMGSLKADAVLKITAIDGKVNIKAISVDLTNMNAYGWLASKLVEAINPSLAADGDGNLELYFEIPLPYLPDIPIWVNIWDGSEAGVSGGWFAPNIINLQGLVEGLMTPKENTCPQWKAPAANDPAWKTMEKDNTYVAPQPMLDLGPKYTTFADPNVGAGGTGTADPLAGLDHLPLPKIDKSKLGNQKTTTETTSETMDDIAPYVNVKRASVDISGLKLGDGAIGNDNAGATLYGSKEGANQIDGNITGGGGGSINSKKLRAKDVYVGNDLEIGDVQVDDASLKTEKLVDKNKKLNKKQKVGGDIGEVRLGDLRYGTVPTTATGKGTSPGPGQQ